MASKPLLGNPAIVPAIVPSDELNATVPSAVPSQSDPLQHASISADEFALYDRQIRLWGVQAQERIRNSNILLVRAKGIANEVAKNLVLAGIGTLTIIDNELVTEEDLGAQFLLSASDVGKNRGLAILPELQKLNPRVRVVADPGDVQSKPPMFFGMFDVTIATDLPFQTLVNINMGCRTANRPFYAACSHGLYGLIFADLVIHDFVIERQKSNVLTKLEPESTTRSVIATNTKKENGKIVEMVTKRENYSDLASAVISSLSAEYLKNRRKLKQVSPLLPALLALWDFEKAAMGRIPSFGDKDELQTFIKLASLKHTAMALPPETMTSTFLRSFMQNMGCELAPVTAILGGQLAQDVINVLGKREQPIQNLLIFDGEESRGPIFALHPILQMPDVGGGIIQA